MAESTSSLRWPDVEVLLFPGLGFMRPDVQRLLGDDLGRGLYAHVERAVEAADLSPDEAADHHRILLCVAAGVHAWLAEPAHKMPSRFLAHSVGVYPALVAAGALSPENAMCAAEVASLCCLEQGPRGDLMGVLGLEVQQVEALCAAIGGVALAADYGPGHTLVGGMGPCLDELATRVRRAGGLPARRLGVCRPYHTPALLGASGQCAARLRRWEGAPLKVPVVLGVGRPSVVLSGPGWAAAVAGQLSAPLDWPAVAIGQVHAASRLSEVGDGRSLQRLTRRIQQMSSAATPGRPV